MTRDPSKVQPRYERWIHKFEEWAAKTAIPDWVMSPRVQRVQLKLPSAPGFVTSRLGTAAPVGQRSLAIPELPDELKTSPGIPRDRAVEEETFRTRGPLPVFLALHHEARSWQQRKAWFLSYILYGTQKRARLDHLTETAPTRKDGAQPADIDPVELTRQVKAKAAEIGLSAIGVAKFDPMLTFGPFLGDESIGDRVVVCVSEQNWAATQKIPGTFAERAHLDGNSQVHKATLALAEYLRGIGYAARASRSNGMAVGYGVEAGLGQLGLNGQLLTPFEGSAARLAIITTNAPLMFDSPVDYGIPAICDRCKSCVRNCPSGAIQSKREMHRGIYKAKVKSERCMPIVAQTHGCGICIKVCPIQRYGLPAVIEEYKRSGAILGKNTDELEGYIWPIDGVYYGPGERPPSASTDAMLKPPGFLMDPQRTSKDTSLGANWSPLKVINSDQQLVRARAESRVDTDM